MAVAIEDLSVLLLWIGAFILASLAYYIAKAIASVIDVDIPLIGHPFHFAARLIENAIVDPLNSLRKASDARIAAGFRDLVDALELGLGVTLLLGLGVEKALAYLWHTALSPFVHGLVDPVSKIARAAAADVAALAKTVAADVLKAEAYARARATAALEAAKAYADTKIAAAIKALRLEIAAAVAFVHEAVGVAADELPGLPGMAWDELNRLLNTKRLWQLAGLLAAVPILAQLVRVLARESGLENAECRGKVKNICTTDPALWEGLLATLVAVGFAYSLDELAAIARPVLADLEPVVRKAA
jgi:hypothetical protein